VRGLIPSSPHFLIVVYPRPSILSTMVSRILILALALYGVAAFPSVEPTNSGKTLGTGSQPSNLKACSKEVKAVAGQWS
jgi:hypothetical protein